jgi:hypothetical protein
MLDETQHERRSWLPGSLRETAALSSAGVHKTLGKWFAECYTRQTTLRKKLWQRPDTRQSWPDTRQSELAMTEVVPLTAGLPSVVVLALGKVTQFT